MFIDFSFFITFFLTMPSSVVLLVCIGVGGCLCSISLSACSAGIDYLKFIFRATSLDSAAEEITILVICAILRMAPLFGGSGESL